MHLVSHSLSLYVVLFSHLLSSVSLPGGLGTPSMASNENIERVMNKARDMFQFKDDFDISIETTPRIAASEPDKILAYYKMV
jgi:hypothetical protein